MVDGEILRPFWLLTGLILLPSKRVGFLFLLLVRLLFARLASVDELGFRNRRLGWTGLDYLAAKREGGLEVV